MGAYLWWRLHAVPCGVHVVCQRVADAKHVHFVVARICRAHSLIKTRVVIKDV